MIKTVELKRINNLNEHRIRKRVILIGFILGLVVNQIMLFCTNSVRATETADSLYAENQINSFDTDDIQNLNTVIQYDSSKPLVNYGKNTEYTKSVTPFERTITTKSKPTTSTVVNTEEVEPVKVWQNTSNYNPNRPEWIEFCPYGLENAQKDESFHLWATNSRYKADNQNYWVDRRKDFERHLAYCDKIQHLENRNACYQKLRLRQERITANYVDPWQKAAIRDEKLSRVGGRWMMYDAIKNKNININHSGTVNKNIYWHSW